MAISIVKQPAKYSPAGDNVIWQVSSDNANIIGFRVAVNVQNKLGVWGVAGTFQIDPTPDLTTGAYIDLSMLLKNLVNWEVNNDYTQFVYGLNDTMRPYKLDVTEIVLTNGIKADGAHITTDTCYAFNATLDTITFNSFDDSNYVVSQGNNAKFLTYKPDGGMVNSASTEFLYFIQDGSLSGLSAQVKVYQKTGTLATTNTVSITGSNSMFRLNVSPKALNAAVGSVLTDGMYYTIQLIDVNAVPVSETRTYCFKDAECYLDLVNLFWVNSLGGLDSYQFINPTETLNVVRTTMKRNTEKLSNGAYSNLTGNMYNPSDMVLLNTPQVTVKINSRVLTDQENYWIGEIVSSLQLFVELTDGKIVPATLKETTLAYTRQKYTKQPTQKSFNFILAEGFIPALSNGSVSYILSTVYKNRQKSKAFQKQGCNTPSEYGSTVVYTVGAGIYSSSISQLDADAQADADIAANGQNHANSAGTCLASPKFWNTQQQQNFTKQGCTGAGAYGETKAYTVPANTYFSYISVADANQTALNDIAANGQTWVNNNAQCLTGIGNDQQQGTYYSQNCASGSTPDAYVVTVAANTYYASDKATANQMAQNYISQNGQTLANQNGTCTVRTINNFVQIVIRFEDNGSSYSYYGTAYADQAVNATINISTVAVHNNQLSVSPTFTIYSGNTASGELYICDSLFADMTVEVTGVTPNQQGNMVYTF